MGHHDHGQQEERQTKYCSSNPTPWGTRDPAMEKHPKKQLLCDTVSGLIGTTFPDISWNHSLIPIIYNVKLNKILGWTCAVVRWAYPHLNPENGIRVMFCGEAPSDSSRLPRSPPIYRWISPTSVPFVSLVRPLCTLALVMPSSSLYLVSWFADSADADANMQGHVLMGRTAHWLGAEATEYISVNCTSPIKTFSETLGFVSWKTPTCSVGVYPVELLL